MFVLMNLALSFLLLFNGGLCDRTGAGEIRNDEIENIYHFDALDIDGNEVSFEKYRGYVLLVVNVASECGLTESNYQQLNDLYDRYGKEGLRIAAFPCNQFGGQEPAELSGIKQFVRNKNVNFDLYSKIDVNGENAHPIFKYLKSKLTGILYSESIKWNFTKFLLDSNGIPVKRYGPLHQPKDIELDIVEELHNRAKSRNKTQINRNKSKEKSNDEL